MLLLLAQRHSGVALAAQTAEGARLWDDLRTTLLRAGAVLPLILRRCHHAATRSNYMPRVRGSRSALNSSTSTTTVSWI